MIDERLKFVFAEPEHVVLPIKMERDRWFTLAHNNNAKRFEAMQRTWDNHEMDALYDRLFA